VNEWTSRVPISEAAFHASFTHSRSNAYFLALFSVHLHLVQLLWLAAGSLALAAVHQFSGGHRKDLGSRYTCNFTNVGRIGVLVGAF
jgi:hypothetical protein